MTHRTASTIFDLPQPLGPTTALRLLRMIAWVGSTNDLKPANLIDFKCTPQAYFVKNETQGVYLKFLDYVTTLLILSW